MASPVRQNSEGCRRISASHCSDAYRQRAWQAHGHAIGDKKPSPAGEDFPTGRAGYCCRVEWMLMLDAIKPSSYLSGGAGSDTTACWWCQKQPETPIAAVIMMAQAIRARIVSPPFLEHHRKGFRSNLL